MCFQTRESMPDSQQRVHVPVAQHRDLHGVAVAQAVVELVN